MNFRRRRTRKQSRPRLVDPSGWGCPKHVKAPPPFADPEPQRRGANHREYERPRPFVVEARYTQKPHWGWRPRVPWYEWRTWGAHRTEAGRDRALVRLRRNDRNNQMHRRWSTPMEFRIARPRAS